MSATDSRFFSLKRDTWEQLGAILYPRRVTIACIVLAVLAGAALEVAPPLLMKRIVDDYTLAFFKKHLKGTEEPLLDGPSDAYPDVIKFVYRDGSSLAADAELQTPEDIGSQ